KALIVTIHHPPFSGDTEHSGSSVAEQALFDSFSATGRYPHLILSGHVHNYQRFTNVVGGKQIPCVVAGAGGYTKLGTLHQINGQNPTVPLPLGGGLTLEQYDTTEFGFLRLEVSKTQIVGNYFAAAYDPSNVPPPNLRDSFTIDLASHTVSTGTSGVGGNKPPKPPKPPKPSKPPKPPKPPKKKRRRH
ncbi:MAG TPA: metallophosphoesterase family protein, partial [Candidatus Angelobacter sp.]